MPKAVLQDLLLEGPDFDPAARRASRLLLICRYRAGKTGMQPTMIPTACSAMLKISVSSDIAGMGSRKRIRTPRAQLSSRQWFG